jgi:hypothetical protein
VGYLERRLDAFAAHWFEKLDPVYANEPVQRFAKLSKLALSEQSIVAGFRMPTERDLHAIADYGGYPGEGWFRRLLRKKLS